VLGVGTVHFTSLIRRTPDTTGPLLFQTRSRRHELIDLIRSTLACRSNDCLSGRRIVHGSGCHLDTVRLYGITLFVRSVRVGLGLLYRLDVDALLLVVVVVDDIHVALSQGSFQVFARAFA
jgi:hypothetical protein